jgi:hypothetical protein
MWGWYCFPKNKFVPLACAGSLPRQTTPRYRFYSTVTTWSFLLCAVDVFNKSLKPSASIGPSLVLCLIHCRSPTPSAFYFALQSWSSAWRFFSSRQWIGECIFPQTWNWRSVHTGIDLSWKDNTIQNSNSLWALVSCHKHRSCRIGNRQSWRKGCMRIWLWWELVCMRLCAGNTMSSNWRWSDKCLRICRTRTVVSRANEGVGKVLRRKPYKEN